jgi:hypothetical protein
MLDRDLWGLVLSGGDGTRLQGLMQERGDAVYDSLRAWNFSRDVLARTPGELVAIPAEDIGWSDWGTPEAIARTLASLKDRAPWRIEAPSATPAAGRGSRMSRTMVAFSVLCLLAGPASAAETDTGKALYTKYCGACQGRRRRATAWRGFMRRSLLT